MPRPCSQCNKLASLENQEPEVSDLEVSGDENGFNVSCSVRIVRVSACCGDEMKETTMELQTESKWSEFTGGVVHDGEGHELSVDEDSSEITERTQNKDRHGRPIKSARYMTSYIGAQVTARVKCECGEFEETVDLSDDVAASSFDEM